MRTVGYIPTARAMVDLDGSERFAPGAAGAYVK